MECILCVHGVYHMHGIFGEQISLANWDLMHFGGHFSLANRMIFSVHCFMTLHNTCDYKCFSRTLNLAIKAKITKLPN